MKTIVNGKEWSATFNGEPIDYMISTEHGLHYEFDKTVEEIIVKGVTHYPKKGDKVKVSWDKVAPEPSDAK